MNKELDACKAKPGGCSDEDSRAIFNEYKALSDQNIAQVQACIFTGDPQCVTKAVSDAASRAEVQNSALDPAQQNVLTVRQTNAGTNSVTGGDGVTSGDLQRAQEVANFRQANCANLSTQHCDVKVADAMGRGQLASVAMVGTALGLGVAIEGTATAGAALAAAIRACATDPLLCANTAGIVAADALTLGATGTGALTVGAVRVTGGGAKAAAQLAEEAKYATVSRLTPAEEAAAGRIIDVAPSELRWTQRTAGGGGRADPIRQSMSENGYVGAPIDVIKTADGIVTVDHTRAAVALELGIPKIPATLHLPSDPLPASMAGRFGASTTWGEAAAYRAATQRPPLSPTGTTTPPRLPSSRTGG
jgi:hypothetical protein